MPNRERPGFMQMIRAPFLSSIIAPLIAGTLVAVIVSGSFSPIGFALLLVMGVGLHIATNVYNDIHDTIQGTIASTFIATSSAEVRGSWSIIPI